MNDDQIIEQLRQLKKLGPIEKTISDLKSRIFSSINTMDPNEAPELHAGFIRSSAFLLFISRPVFIYPATSLLLLLLVLTQGSRLLDISHIAYLETRIATTSNGYDKAQWSLALAQATLKNFESGRANPSQIAYLAGASSQTDQYMNALHLTGLPGQYSTEQCLSAYRAYGEYLEDMRGAIQVKLSNATDPSVRESLANLQNEIQHYQQAADTRLKLY